jgi:tetratricopeptide (TPR) repeat protein
MRWTAVKDKAGRCGAREMAACVAGILLVLAVCLGGRPALAAASPGDVKAQQAAIAFRQGRMQEALGLYEAALADRTLGNERRASVLTDRGVVYARLRQVAEAIDDFNAAIKLFPEYSVVYNNRGALLVKLGAVEEALKDFHRALSLAPGYAAAHANRAGALASIERYGQAVDAYTDAIRVAPQSVEPLAGRAGAYVALDRPRAALRDLTRAIANDQRFSLGYRQRAEALLALDEPAAAAQDLSRAIAFDPNNSEYYLLRGRAYLAAKDPQAAVRDFTKVIELKGDADAGTAYLERGHASILVEDFETAEQDLAKALERDPQSALAYAYRALMYKKLGQPELGAQEVEKALLLDKSNAVVLWARGEIDEAMGQGERAAQAYRKAHALKPGMENAIYGLKRLGETVDDDFDLLNELSFGGWRVYGGRSQYFATNDEFSGLRIPLEMAGEGQPKLLAWEMQKGEFDHIGLLRFSAGAIERNGNNEPQEFVAIIDTVKKALVGIEPHRSGEKTSKWSWGSGRVVVAAVDGLRQEYLLVRRTAPSVAASRGGQTPSRASRGRHSGPDWAPWMRDQATSRRRVSRRDARRARRRQKPKSLFDLLFGN